MTRRLKMVSAFQGGVRAIAETPLVEAADRIKDCSGCPARTFEELFQGSFC